MAKVAIIEDDQAIQQMYRLKLAQAGYDVKTASDGAQGLKLVEDFRPNIILLDLMLPEMTGDAMLAKVRATEWGKDLKVIVLTNVSQDEAPEILKELNISRYVVKAHHTPGQVADIVEDLLTVA